MQTNSKTNSKKIIQKKSTTFFNTLPKLALLTATLYLPNLSSQASYFESLKPAFLTATHSTPKKTILYFASQDCPKTQKFTPQLIQWYKTQKAQDIEVVFISNDLSEMAMRNHMYYSNMPWPCIKYNARSYTKIQKFWNGETRLVLLDHQGNPQTETRSTGELSLLLSQNTSTTIQPNIHTAAEINTRLPARQALATLPNLPNLERLPNTPYPPNQIMTFAQQPKNSQTSKPSLHVIQSLYGRPVFIVRTKKP